MGGGAQRWSPIGNTRMQLLAPGGGAKHHIHCEFWPTSRPFQEFFPPRHTLTFGPPISAFISRPALFPPKPPPHPFYHIIIRKCSFMSCFLLCHLLSAFPLMLFAVPAHGLGSLPNDEGGVSGAMHRLAGERDWMLGAGLVQSDNCGGTRAVRWTLTQALQQSKHWPLA